MILAVAAQKGGVGKTSLTFHLAGVLAEQGQKILLCDLDPQHSLSSTLVDNVFNLERTLRELLSDPDVKTSEVVRKTKFQNIHILPCNLSLGLIELDLLSDPDSQFLLSDKLEEITKVYDFILLDCPPNLGIFTRIALVSSNKVIIPLECSSYAVRSTMYLLELIEKIKKRPNPELEVLGFVINKIDTRRKIENSYQNMIRQNFHPKVFSTEIKDSAKYAEAVALKIPVNFYQPKSEQAEALRQLLREIQNHNSMILKGRENE